MTELLQKVLDAHGGLQRWYEVGGAQVALSIGGPIWEIKGCAEQMGRKTLFIETTRQRSTLAGLPDQHSRAIFDAELDQVRIQHPGSGDEARERPRESFTGLQRASPWDQFQLAYFLGYALWNYFTTPFLFTYPGVRTQELGVWREAGQSWRRLAVSFPASITTHSNEQVFYFDTDFMQRRMDYTAEVVGHSPVAHYSDNHRSFDGIILPTRRRVCRRNPDGSSTRDQPTIAIDVHDVAFT